MLNAGVDPNILASAGWGIVVPEDLDPGFINSLVPLISLRQSQALDRFRVLKCRQGEDSRSFLARYGVGLSDVVDPDRIPYYLMLAGGPDLISFDFQNQLNTSCAVGRVDFADADHFASYAQSVVRAETRQGREIPACTFFCADKVPDPSMQGAAEFLVQPVVEGLNGKRIVLTTESIGGVEATRESLANVFGSRNLPDLLVTAASGVGFPPGHELQLSRQGGLLCCPPVHNNGSPQPFSDSVFSADDVPSDADLTGMISIHVGSFSAGTPRIDSLGVQITGQEKFIAPGPFVARLPQRLLSNYQGGALAVIGHNDRIGFYGSPESRWADLRRSLQDCVSRLARGARAGHSIQITKMISAIYWANLQEELGKTDSAAGANDVRIADLWTKLNVIRSLMLLGDPAVRICHANASASSSTSSSRE
jgi:hypothetical protein